MRQKASRSNAALDTLEAAKGFAEKQEQQRHFVAQSVHHAENKSVGKIHFRKTGTTGYGSSEDEHGRCQ